MSIEQRFVEATGELLLDLEASILKLEESPNNKDCVDRVFRTMHTIKGTGEMFGYAKLAQLSHELENAFELVRDGDMEITQELINICLDSTDHMRNMLGSKCSNNELDKNTRRIKSRIMSLVAVYQDYSQSLNEKMIESEQQLPINSEIDKTIRLRIKPKDSTFSTVIEPIHFLRDLMTLGDCHVTTLVGDIPELCDYDASKCYLQWDVLLTTDCSDNVIDNKIAVISDGWLVEAAAIDNGGHWSDVPEDKQLGEILIERGDVTEAQVEYAQSLQKRIGEILSDNVNISPDKIESALHEQSLIRKAKSQRQSCEISSNVKVSANKLDTLIELVGDLAVSQSKLTEFIRKSHDPDLHDIVDEIERIAVDLRDNALSLRMMPVGTVFTDCRRLIRDLSSKQGKKVQFITQGAEIELDKCIVERLSETLLHLIKNSIDHGIESPDSRVKQGKPESGLITLNIFYSLSSVVITLHDDGSGLDIEAIKQKAIDLGMLNKSEEVSTQDIYNLIFQPGFTTSKAISDVSGRGVGMDSVKHSVESLRGKISIDSSKSQGSTVTIVLPQTLAFIESLVVLVSNRYYVFPLTLVEQCIDVNDSEVELHNDHIIDFKAQKVPLMSLNEVLHNEANIRASHVVVISVGDLSYGFKVDDIVGRQQTIIKGLGKEYQGVKGLAGETVMNSGDVAMIVDSFDLISAVTTDKKTIH